MLCQQYLDLSLTLSNLFYSKGKGQMVTYWLTGGNIESDRFPNKTSSAAISLASSYTQGAGESSKATDKSTVSRFQAVKEDSEDVQSVGDAKQVRPARTMSKDTEEVWQSGFIIAHDLIAVIVMYIIKYFCIYRDR